MTDFILEVKSSVERKVADLAASLSVPFADLDDLVNTDNLLSSDVTCLVWRFISMDEDPSDPLYSLSFVVGVKTSNDPSNYSLLSIVSKIKSEFSKDTWTDIKDYSSSTPPVAVSGGLYVTDSGVDQQIMDRQSGSRMLTITAKVVRES